MPRPVPFITLLAGLALPLPLLAQIPRVNLVVTLAPQADPAGRGARRPWVQVRDLLADQRWSQALDQSFPIRLEFRLEIWRSREGWLDDFQRATEWSLVIQREPLQDQYKVTRILLSGPEEFRFASRDELDRWVRQVNQVDVLPRGTGTFYYNVILRITALSDEDMEELERFLAGDTEPPRRPPSSLGRSLRRILLRLAGLPLQDLESRSENFIVR